MSGIARSWRKPRGHRAYERTFGRRRFPAYGADQVSITVEKGGLEYYLYRCGMRGDENRVIDAYGRAARLAAMIERLESRGIRRWSMGWC